MNIVVLPVTDVSAIPMSLLSCADPGMEPAMEYLHRASFLGAYLCSRLVGICALVKRDSRQGEIASIAVNDPRRSHDIAVLLVKNGIRFARSSHWKELVIETGNSNADDLNAWQSLGFKIASVDRGFFTKAHQTPLMKNGAKCTDRIKLKIDL